MKINLILFVFFAQVLHSTTSHAVYSGLKGMETTRTKSMSGAGVGSVLLNEAVLLNPASIIFFNSSSLYFQRDTYELRDRSPDRTDDYREAQNELYLITDTSAAIKGGISYQYQRENAGRRIRYGASFAKNIGKKSALGLIYTYSDEDTALIKKKYNQVTIGGTHIHSRGLSLGFTIIDPSQSISEYFKYTIGAQYTLNSFIIIVADIGSGDSQNYEKESFVRWSLQLQSFERVFLRYGSFHDKLLNEKGTGVGISWVGPRFSLDYAHKVAEQITQEADKFFDDEKVTETSFGLTVLF